MTKSSSESNPRVRTEGLVVEELDGEVLVYDLERDRAHRLNDSAALVWKNTDGTRSVGELARIVGDERAVRYALGLLSRSRLLEGEFDAGGVSRRDFFKRAAVVGAMGVVAIPVVQSIVAPTPAHAATCLPGGSMCTSSAQCCSGVCNAGSCL